MARSTKVKKFAATGDRRRALIGSPYQELFRDAFAAQFADVVTEVGCLRKTDRKRLVGICERILHNNDLVARDDNRVPAVKILVALLPLSLDAIERWLKVHKHWQAYEVHFTLFCFLDNVPNMALDGRVVQRVLDAISEYLRNVPEETGHAAWMAGDLLGEHWASPQTLKILVTVLGGGRYAAGRLASLYGIERRLASVEHRSSIARRISEILQKAAQCDRSQKVRSYADLLRKRE